ncbi:type II toxin-antitoxin system RelE/ParE family toxin [Gluconacetobacter sacchari]|uniref:type II toxin-antitoxin system RelE/ParE family toxin n=1 Tax=Gluconacetobacter sacchari TaxID=92759 RepID=UPI0039B6E8B9
MPSYTLSGEADSDVQGIIALSIRNWGWARAERYILELHAAFETLATYPDMGVDVGDLRSGYFRFVHDSHAVFYRKTDDGIFVVRVLHQRQEPKHYL